MLYCRTRVVSKIHLSLSSTLTNHLNFYSLHNLYPLFYYIITLFISVISYTCISKPINTVKKIGSKHEQALGLCIPATQVNNSEKTADSELQPSAPQGYSWKLMNGWHEKRIYGLAIWTEQFLKDDSTWMPVCVKQMHLCKFTHAKQCVKRFLKECRRKQCIIKQSIGSWK